MAFFYYICIMKKSVLVHIAIWAFLLMFPLLFYSPEDTIARSWNRVVRAAGSTVCLMILFYTNYLWLAPKLYFNSKKRKFYIVNITLIITGTIIAAVWWETTHHILAEASNPPGMPLPKPPTSLLPPPLQMLLFYNLISLSLTVVLSVTLRLSEINKRLENERHEIERRRSEAELVNLRSQLNPHFLLNTLNNIYALISFDTDKAQHAVEELSKLLRYVLYENESNFVPLYKEVEFINNYVELMKIRVTDNVKVTCDINIADDDSTPVAPLLFISLIENAFKHGISQSGHGYINIMLNQADGNITCCITNSNHPKRANDKSGSGIGLEQVARRLDLLYPDRYKWQRGLNEDMTEYHSKLEIYK